MSDAKTQAFLERFKTESRSSEEWEAASFAMSGLMDLRAERDAANVELHRMHTEWLAARVERDAAQTALGLASEEVRALRAARCWNCDAPRIDPDAPERTEP